MNLKLKKPLIILDLEATGDHIVKDRIVEIAMIKLHPDGKQEKYEKRINPKQPIPIEISEIHGIYDFDVLKCPSFKDLANEIKEFISDSDLGGFNSNKFDIPMLEEEFMRSGISSDFIDKKLIDVQNIFHKMEKRTLIAAYKFYCNKDLENAHSAMHDAQATLDVLMAQIDRYEELENHIEFLSEFSKAGQRALDYANRISLNKENEPTINFGKHKGKLVKEVFKKEPGYFSWIMKGDFSANTKACFQKIWDEIKEKK